MKHKNKWLFLAAFVLLVLTGFGKKSVELLSDKKLIDLNAAITICLPGGDSVWKEDNGKQEVPETPTVTPEPTAAPTVAPEKPEDTEGQKRTITISVRDRVISYDSGSRISSGKLEEKVRQDYKKGADFKLVDDFAEAHVYREIIAILEKLEAEIGISYTRD